MPPFPALAVLLQSPAARLGPVDLALVAVYLVGITVFGLRFRTRAGAGSVRNYFLADNTIPWWAIALSIVSAETSTLTIVSIPGVAYAGNLRFLQVVLGYLLGRVVVAGLFLPRYFAGSMLTAYQLIDQRFGHGLHKLTAGLFLLTRAAAEGVRVFAISIVVSIAIGTGDVLSIGIISALTLLYTFEGGLAAVIWTDVVQMALYVAGTVVAVFTLGHLVPGSWPGILHAAGAAGKLSVFDFSLDVTRSYTFWAGVLGGTFLTMASHGTDQLMVQRMLAARNLRESRWALLSSGVVIFVQFGLFLLIGTGLWLFYRMHPETFRSNDHIFPTFIVERMPHGVAGLLIAAILAAAMSNLSAALNSLASTTVVDFYLPWRRWRGLGEARLAGVSRLATVVWAAVLFGIAVYSVHAGGKGHVVETGLSIASVAYGCLLGVFLLGTLTRAATQAGAMVGMGVGFLLNVFLYQATFPAPLVPLRVHVAFTWYVLIGAGVTFVVGMVASVAMPKRRMVAAAGLMVGVALCGGLRSGAQVVSPGSVGSVPVGSVPARGNEGAGVFAPVSAVVNDALAAGKLPGAVVVVGHRGEVVFEQAYGVRKVAGEPGVDGKAGPAEAMTEDTLFDMASLTKVLVTTTAVLQLVEQGKLELDAPVVRYLPEFGQNGKGGITVRDLMTHYSGLPEDVNLKDPWGLAAPDKAEGIRRAMAAVPYGPAGVMFKYSDINFITLGALVERVSGMRLEDYAREFVLGPLGMSESGYHPFGRTCGPVVRVGAAVEPGPKPVGRIGVTCLPGTWSPLGLDPRTAPTAHDNEGTAETNPNFDRLLRGTVHDPTTRRMGGVAGHAGLFSTAADTAKFAQALLDKLLRNTGPFPLAQETLQMATVPQQPGTAQGGATIFLPDGTPMKGVALRGLGWDVNSAFSRPRGTVFATVMPGQSGGVRPSFGHTGFTGTSVWIDPASDTYVVMLANAIHPRGRPAISQVRGDVATAAAQVIRAINAAARQELRGGSHWIDKKGICEIGCVIPAIDVLEAFDFDDFKPLLASHGNHLRVGLLSNNTALDTHGRRTIDVLAQDLPKALPGASLTMLFTPEHGLGARQDTEHPYGETDPETKLPVVALYGPKAADKRPKQADLRGLDAVVIDLQDAGVRFWTYETVLGYMLEGAAQAGIDVVVLDRPNPIGGVAVQGPMSAVGYENYTDYMVMPVRHGMTMGELARYFNANAKLSHMDPALLDAHTITIGTPTPAERPAAMQPGLGARLTVIRMRGWRRSEMWAETGLQWTPPSPNLKSAGADVLYPALGLTEQTNVSVGRGTATPFENLGAPWMKVEEVAAYLTGRGIAGVRVTASRMTVGETPEHYPFHGQTIPAVHFEVTDAGRLDTPELGLEILAALHRLYPKEFELGRAKNLLANPEVLGALMRGEDPRGIRDGDAAGVAGFRGGRAACLLYP